MNKVGDIAAWIRPERKTDGISAVLLPLHESGDPDLSTLGNLLRDLENLA